MMVSFAPPADGLANMKNLRNDPVSGAPAGERLNDDLGLI